MCVVENGGVRGIKGWSRSAGDRAQKQHGRRHESPK